MSSIAFADSQTSPLRDVLDSSLQKHNEKHKEKEGNVKIFEDTIEVDLQDMINQMQQQ